MSFVKFNPRPVMGLNTNGVSFVYQILNENDQSWLTQGTSSVCNWACAGGNGYFAAVSENVSEDDKTFLRERELVLQKICSAIAEFVSKDYDAEFTRSVEKERTVTVEVPKVRKVGLFKKEEYIDYETRTEKYFDTQTFTFNGWRIERLYRQEGNGSSAETVLFDYCLGSDGKIYFVVSEKDNNDTNVIVLNSICFSPAFLSNRFCNVYSAAISGVLGALDAIPVDKNDPLRNVHLRLDDDYYYNFPIQIDDGHSFTYGFLDGTIARLVNLLDDDDKDKCYKKYDWMGTFLYPEKEVGSATQAKFRNAMRGFEFSEYVLFGAKEVSKKPYAIEVDDFRTDPNGCFLTAFLTNRLVAADALEKRYPKFDILVKSIIDNQKELSGQKLIEERQLATEISQEYNEDGNVPESIFVLLTAYATFLAHGSTDDKTSSITEMMVDRICSFNVVKGGWEEFLIAVALWFSDRDGYRDAVVKQYNDLSNQSNTPTEPYSEKIDMDLYAKIGAMIYGQYDGDVDLRFVSALIQYKLPVAQKIANKHPEFAPAYEFMCANNEEANLADDFDAVFKTPDLFSETDCAILMAALGTFLDRGNADRSTSNNCIICVERALNKPGAEVVGLASITLLCVALWFSDYKGYKEQVYTQIKNLMEQGWYSEDKRVDINEVRESIEKAKF